MSRICGALIEASWLAALIVTPLFFNTYSSRVFEPDKLHLLRSIALLAAAAWLVQFVDSGWRNYRAGHMSLWARIRTTPLVLPTLLLVLAYFISTVFSLVPRISFFGSYVRLQGTYTFLSYVILFLVLLTHLRTRAQFSRILYAVILTSVPISIYGMIQHYGWDPLPWGGDVQQRVAGNMGNAIFVAAYLIMAFFLTVERLVDSVSAVLTEDHFSDVLRVLGYTFIIGIQSITIIFTQSRGPWLGWAAGAYVFAVIGALLLSRRSQSLRRQAQEPAAAAAPAGNGHGPGISSGNNAWARRLGLVIIGVTIVSLVFLLVLNLPQSPLASLRKERYVGRMGSLLSLTEGTNAVRVLIWEGVVDMMFEPHAALQYPDGKVDVLNPIRPLIGYGPESLWVAYNRFYPPDLAHYEARNASPDRSHNETFDALVRTGFLGLLAQFVLYGSIFFFALRWLGLVGNRNWRNLLLGLLVGGAVAGILAPWLFDHSLRLVGLGLPVGMIVGLVSYVALALFFPDRAGLHVAAEAGPAAGDVQASGWRQVAILALFAALVANFVEIHFGIAIASTLTHFWILAGVLVVIGMGWLTEGDLLLAGSERREVAVPEAMPAAVPARAAVQAAPGKSTRSRRAEAARTGTAGRGAGLRERPTAARPVTVSGWRLVAPYALIGAIVTLVLVWDFVINQTGVSGAFDILWRALTSRLDAGRNPIGSPWLLFMVLLTWLLGGMLALSEVFRSERAARGAYRWGAYAGLYAAVVLGVFFIYGLWQASLTQIGSLAGLDIFQHIASYLILFDSALLVMGALLAAAIWLADCRPAPSRWLGQLPVLSLGAAVVLPVLAIIVSLNVNVQSVQADIFYKQGLAYEEAGEWEGAIVLYDQAAKMQPAEDYYYLFLGRALLEYAIGAQPGSATLPLDAASVPAGSLLPLAESALGSGSREELMRAAHLVLVGAQRLNPLNTDHTANLARLFRTWAFANAVSATDQQNNQAMRQLVLTKPDQVDMGKLDQALAYYQQATALSPNNVGLWNELAGVLYLKGDHQAAVADLNRSLELDKSYYPTYLLKGDVLSEAGDKAGALAAYKQALAMRPTDLAMLSAVGVYSAQLGDTQGALDAFQRVIDIEAPALAKAQDKLNALGGQGSDASRQALQKEIATHRDQLQTIYRNQVLVLRDAGRYREALAAAQSALANATAEQRPPIEQLIADLQKRQG